MRWPFLIIFTLALAACGQKGDLYLPEKAAGDTPVHNKSARDMSSGEQFKHTI